MKQVKVINISGEISRSYVEELEKAGNQVEMIEPACISSISGIMDAIIIYNDAENKIGEVCQLILAMKEIGFFNIVILSKNISDVERLLYVQLGLNNILHGTCSPKELQLFIRNSYLIKGFDTSRKEKLDISKLFEDSHSIVDSVGHKVALTRLEYQFLALLEETPGNIIKYDQIYEKLWGESNRNSRASVANLVCHLREKFEMSHMEGISIKNVRSQGYKLETHK